MTILEAMLISLATKMAMVKVLQMANSLQTRAFIKERYSCKSALLKIIFHLVFLTPFNLRPNSFIDKHETGLEDGVGTGDLGGHGDIFGDENGHGQSVADGKQPPNQGLHQRATGTVGT